MVKAGDYKPSDLVDVENKEKLIFISDRSLERSYNKIGEAEIDRKQNRKSITALLFMNK